ncbi:MAG: hypothetical protein QHC90_23170 [Shinella sp.]|nr:hypothetical protein [Shinella sp.]
MHLSQVVQILARRLGIRPSRVSAIGSRLQHVGRIPIADGSRRYPPEIDDEHAAILLIAVLADRGLGMVPATTEAYVAMTSPEGHRLLETVLAIVRGRALPGDFIFREGGVTGVVDRQHAVFGNPAENGTARFATGPTMAAIAAELQGISPSQADAIAAITRIPR